MLPRTGNPNGAAFRSMSGGRIDNSLNSLDTIVHVFSKLVDPKADNLPAKASKLMIPPKIINLPHTTRVAVISVTINLDDGTEVTFANLGHKLTSSDFK